MNNFDTVRLEPFYRVNKMEFQIDYYAIICKKKKLKKNCLKFIWLFTNTDFCSHFWVSNDVLRTKFEIQTKNRTQKTDESFYLEKNDVLKLKNSD